MRIVFMGTPEFAVPCLDILIREEHSIVAVITQPDRPKGRGRRITAPPVKKHAMENDIRVLQPEKVRTREFAEELGRMEPELVVTVAYGRILPSEVLEIPHLGCINIHASLLPKYRGAAPINHALINGERITGITSMFMDEGMDTGDIILQKSVEINENMDAGHLHDILSELGAEVLKRTVRQFEAGEVQRTPQDDSMANYAPMLGRDTGRINWNKSSRAVHNLVRGTNPWPSAYTYYEGKRMKIFRTTVENEKGQEGQNGRILSSGRDGMFVRCGEGVLRVHELQMENARRMDISECWHNICEGELLG